jgi:hypothetical protein
LIQVQFHSEAQAELGEAVEFYESRVAGLGMALAAEVQRTLGFIESSPAGGAPLGEKLRKLVVRRFPYSVIYRREGRFIYVLAIAHDRRRPGYWKVRQSAS